MKTKMAEIPMSKPPRKAANGSIWAMPMAQYEMATSGTGPQESKNSTDGTTTWISLAMQVVGTIHIHSST